MNRIIIYILLLVYGFCGITSSQIDSLNTFSNSRISFSVVGDAMVHQTQLIYANDSEGNYDFFPVFREIKACLEPADFAIANLETVCAGDLLEYSGYPNFNTPDSFLDALKDCGFDLLLTANNHLLDMGMNAAKRTMSEIIKRGIKYSGTNSTEEEYDSIKVFEINNISFSILSYTYFSNHNNPHGHSYLLNIIDLEKVASDIKKAKEIGSDLIIVNYHFGVEEQREPDDTQKQIINKTIELGADIILGGHPHRLQPIDLFKTNEGNLDTGFVAYSMGNFVSNQRWRYNDAGAILNFTVEKVSDGKFELSDLSFIPTWVYKGLTDRGKEFIVVPSEYAFTETAPNYIKESDKKLMKESFNDCIEIFNKYSDRPKLKLLFNTSLSDTSSHTN